MKLLYSMAISVALLQSIASANLRGGHEDHHKRLLNPAVHRQTMRMSTTAAGGGGAGGGHDIDTMLQNQNDNAEIQTNDVDKNPTVPGAGSGVSGNHQSISGGSGGAGGRRKSVHPGVSEPPTKPISHSGERKHPPAAKSVHPEPDGKSRPHNGFNYNGGPTKPVTGSEERKQHPPAAKSVHPEKPDSKSQPHNGFHYNGGPTKPVTDSGERRHPPAAKSVHPEKPDSKSRPHNGFHYNGGPTKPVTGSEERKHPPVHPEHHPEPDSKSRPHNGFNYNGGPTKPVTGSEERKQHPPVHPKQGNQLQTAPAGPGDTCQPIPSAHAMQTLKDDFPDRVAPCDTNFDCDQFFAETTVQACCVQDFCICVSQYPTFEEDGFRCVGA